MNTRHSTWTQLIISVIIMTLVTLAASLWAASSVRAADTALSSAIADATGIERVHSPRLQAIAAERVAEIQTDFSHDQMQTAEILYFGNITKIAQSCPNEPLRCAVNGWLNSPGHYAIMTDTSLNAIGCASFTDATGTYWAACAFELVQVYQLPRSAISTRTAPPPAMTITTLPDTAMDR